MYTQNTPVHVRLWHKDFWLLVLADMFVSMAMYVQLPLLPQWMVDVLGCQPSHAAAALGVSGLGLFALGCFCSYLVQRYRRNMVCVASLLVMAASFYALFQFACGRVFGYASFTVEEGFLFLLALRFVQGAVFGLAQMVLSSTLIIDTCDSFHRTEANHLSAWFARFALSLGPALALVLSPMAGFGMTMLAGAALCLLSVVCIMMVKFPFKAPEDVVRNVSADRFFLPQGKWLFVNLVIVSAVIGLLFSVSRSALFYVMLLPGFVLALLAERFVFANAEPKAEAVAGMMVLIAALLLLMFGFGRAVTMGAPVLAGCGVGLVGARFQLFFIKLSPHCRRGTSQSTFFLAWELGLSVGLFVGWGLFYDDAQGIETAALVLAAVALAMYLLFTDRWYERHKNR